MAEYSPLFGQGKRNPKVMIIQDSPLLTEYRRKSYMMGKAGKMLRMAFGEIGISVEDMYFTSLVKIPLEEDRAPTPKEGKEWADMLWSEIDTIKPDYVIPVANQALKVLIGLTGITKHRGKLTTTEEGYKIFPLVHPNLILKQPQYADNFTEDLITLESLMSGAKVEGRMSFTRERYYPETYEEVIAEINRLIALPAGTEVSIDLETVKANPYLNKTEMSNRMKEAYPDSERVKISAIGFSDRPGYGTAIPLYHRQNMMPGNQIGAIIKSLRVLLERKDLEWVTQNGKFEIKWIRKHIGADFTFKWDTMLMHYLGVTEEKGTHGLDDFAWLYTDMGGYDSALNDAKPTGEADQGNYDLIDWDVLKVYLADDCDVTLRVNKIFKPIITDNPENNWLWENLMLPASFTLADIEEDGAKVDTEWLQHLKVSYKEEIERITAKLMDYPEVVEMGREKQDKWAERVAIASIPKAMRTEEQQDKFVKYKKFDPSKGGQELNFGSTKQLGELLFERLGLTTVVLTDKGNYSTNDDSLKYMRKQHPICETLMLLRKVTHLNNNFVSGMEVMIDEDGFIHGSYNLHGTVTGRLSSNEPNMQQIPRKNNNPLEFQYWNEIKKLFVSRFGDDGVIGQFDYSQLELRILAVFSQDPALIELYNSGADLHKAVASDAFGVPIEEVTKDQRTASKKIQFGVVYQEGAKGLSEDLRAEGITMSVAECERFIKNYFKRFPKVEKWIKDIKRKAKREKKVHTLTGRTRNLATIDSVDNYTASQAERQAVNAPIQSTGSDCTLMSLILINQWLKETGKLSRICVTVHDSIVLDMPKSEAIEVSEKVMHIMENLAEYVPFYKFLGDVPIVSEMEIGYNYAECFEGSLDELKEKGVDGFIQEQLANKKAKEEAVYAKCIEEGTRIPKFVTGYWENVG
ncbi:DNA polymerase I [Exiguobacterium phage vB_EalM-132]|nr:DNA polymerase I [Exiguobacterium phage vB_EalM-132]